MQHNYSQFGLLSVGALALVLMGMGCIPTPPDDGVMDVSPDAMMGEDTSGDTMMRGDAMNDDPNMVGGDAMVGDDESMMEEDGMMKDDDAMMEKEDTMMEQSVSGSFEAYSEDKLSRANDGTVVLAFLADWCPTCRAVKSDINAQLDEIPAGLSILDINYDTATALRQKYGVTTQHTFVQVDANGNLIKKWSGGNTLESIVNQVS